MKHNRELRFILGVIFLYLIITQYKLDTIPGEWFGDISIIHEYILNILGGKWPLEFSLSAGPLYPYLIAPFVKLLGVSYYTYKILSVSCGLIGILIIYLFVKELVSVRLAVLTSLITVVSFWYIVWTRIGNLQIFIPLLVSLTMYFFVRYCKYKKRKDYFVSVAVASSGLFVYPQTFVLPLALFLMFIYHFLTEKTLNKNVHTLIAGFMIFILAFTVFISIIQSDPNNFTSGYVGSKLFGISKYSLTETISRFFQNVIKWLLMLHVEGDIIFRVNVPKSPQLDVVSGIFFLLGIIYWAKTNKKWLGTIMLSVILLSLPSLSPAHPSIEIPNSGRTIGIIPFVYLFVASGIYYVDTWILKRFRTYASYAFLVIIIGIILTLNLHKYFVLYPQTLPNKNTAYGKIIAAYIDTFPQDTKVLLAGCCWGEWGQPEPKGIYYVLKNYQGRDNLINEAFTLSCDQIKQIPTLIIFDPNEVEKIKKFRTCFSEGLFQEYLSDNGQRVFSSLNILRLTP